MKLAKYISWLMVFLLFFPIPIGIGRTQINILACVFAVLGFITFGIKLSKNQLIEVVGFVSLFSSVTIINGYYSDWSSYQTTRELLFAIIGFSVFNWGSKSVKFYEALDKALPKILPILTLQIGVYFLNPAYVNSALDYSDQYTNIGRLYIYPFSLVLMLLPIVIMSRAPVMTLSSLLLTASSASKQVIAYLLFLMSTNAMQKPSIKKILLLFTGVLAIVGAAYEMGFAERVIQFLDEGDNARSMEIGAAFSKIQEGYNLFTGIGFGIPYWGGWASAYNIDPYEAWVVNSQYEVHNGFISLLLRVGLIGMIWIFSIIYRMNKKLPLRLRFQYYVYIFMNLLSSVSFFYADMVFYVIVLGYYQYKYGKN